MLYLLLVLSISITNAYDNGYCSASDSPCSDQDYGNTKFLFYDVNPPEGFNLRRDVYMRFAIMLAEAQKSSQWSLVLPPWYNLYHWKTATYSNRKPLPWNMFFDVKSLKKYAPVLELHEVFKKNPGKILNIDTLYVLTNYPDPFENGEFREKWEISQSSDCYYDGDFWGYPNVTVTEIVCVKFQGKASKLWELLLLHPNDKKVMFAHGEIALHDKYGTKEYWNCRKSMKFNEELIATAKSFISTNFNINGESTKYVGIHWRRQDFVRSRSKESPSVSGTVRQVDSIIKKKKINTKQIFVATDTSVSELNNLKSQLSKLNYTLHYFQPTEKQLKTFKDGGIAIIEQIICSYSDYFIGTHESTFSFRIQEEREILGYPSETTFNRLCPDTGPCEKPSKWTIVT